MNNSQALYNEDANKIVEQAAQEWSAKRKFIFFLNLDTIAIIARDTKSTEDESETFNKVWNHSNLES